MPQSKDQKILKDEVIVLSNPNKPAPELMRRIVALVEIDGEEREMVFLTNNLEWSPRSVADLYRCRWQIEVFFKQIKQTLQLADFLGHNANAVRWQVWMALLIYVLLRYLSYVSKWAHSFTQLFTILIECFDMTDDQSLHPLSDRLPETGPTLPLLYKNCAPDSVFSSVKR
jgi:hypothetical protein